MRVGRDYQARIPACVVHNNKGDVTSNQQFHHDVNHCLDDPTKPYDKDQKVWTWTMIFA